jgi:hypothetical protein
VYRLTWRLPLAGLVAFSHLQFSQIRGRQPLLKLCERFRTSSWHIFARRRAAEPHRALVNRLLDADTRHPSQKAMPPKPPQKIATAAES